MVCIGVMQVQTDAKVITVKRTDLHWFDMASIFPLLSSLCLVKPASLIPFPLPSSPPLSSHFEAPSHAPAHSGFLDFALSPFRTKTELYHGAFFTAEPLISFCGHLPQTALRNFALGICYL